VRVSAGVPDDCPTVAVIANDTDRHVATARTLVGRGANVLIEKTNFNIQGAAQYLFREFSKVFADCTYINVGDDLGFENLRRVKMSYRPAMFGEKIILRRLLPE